MCSNAGRGQESRPGQPLQDLRLGLERLRTEDLDSVPASCMGDDMVELRRHINACEGEFMRRLTRFDTGQGYTITGALDARPWLGWQCRLSASAAADRVEVSHQLASLPETAKALADGDISYQHAALIARTAEKLGDRMESHAEDILVKAAKDLDPARLRVVTMRLRHCLDADGVLADANDAHDERFLHLSQTFGGVFMLDGRLDAEGGAALRTALNALSGPPAPDDHRRPSQRHADALVEMARQKLDRGDLPEVGGQRPHLAVTVEMATLAKQPGSPAAELEWAQPIPAETARRLACDASITPIVRGPESHQVSAGPTSRVVPGALRKALVARDRGCRFPGCDRPPDWTDAHHLKHWADGGETNADNLVLLCRRHHRYVHEKGWQLGWDADNSLVAVPP